MGSDAPQTMRLIDLVDTVEEEIIEGMEHDHDHDHEKIMMMKKTIIVSMMCMRLMNMFGHLRLMRLRL